MQNPLSTSIFSIELISDLSSDNDINLLKSNNFCQFERIEMEESVNNVFPTGALLIRDTGDIVSYIAKKEIKKIKLKFFSNNSQDQEPQPGETYTWYITSVTYVNNMASETDQTFVCIYFTNKLFYESQLVSFYDERYSVDSDGEIIDGTDTPVWPTDYPFVTTPEHILKTYAKKRVFSAPEFSQTSGQNADPNAGCGYNFYTHNTQETINYVMFRPKIADAMRREQFQTNIITYLNYIFTYAINYRHYPYYMFWTDFTNCLNYKFFDLFEDLSTGEFKFDLPNTDNKQIQAYAIYDSNDVERNFTIDGNEDVPCKKIHVMVTNPAYSLIDKNYYYIRSCPMYMEDTSEYPGGTFSDASHLMSPFLSQSDNTTLSTITTYTKNESPGLTYSLRTANLKDKNLVYLQDKGYQGFSKDLNPDRLVMNTVDAIASYESLVPEIEATPLALRDSYDPEFGKPPIFPFNDNLYMWQYPFDITSNHPNRRKSPQGISSPNFYKQINQKLNSASQGDIPNTEIFTEILNEVSINKVLKTKYDAMVYQEQYDNEKRKEVRQAERENFVAHVLCCMGKDLTPKEDWFFAEITGYIKDKRKLIGKNQEILVENLNDAWLYSWRQLQPGPFIAGFTAGNTADVPVHASNHNMFHGWTGSRCIGSTGSPSLSDIDALESGLGFTGIETWAVNLNERLNGLEPSSSGLNSYRGPGFNVGNITNTGSFSIKPIGFTGAIYANQSKGSARHIVKMHKIGITELRDMGFSPLAPNLSGEYVYYFIAENALDGACDV